MASLNSFESIAVYERRIWNSGSGDGQVLAERGLDGICKRKLQVRMIPARCVRAARKAPPGVCCNGLGIF